MKPQRPSRKNFTFDDFRDEPTDPIGTRPYQPPQPAYKNPYAPFDHQRMDADRDIGDDQAAFASLKKGAAMKNNTFEDMDFDVSDTPQEPMPAKKKGPPPVPVKRDPKLANRGHSYNPGMPPRKNEATPFGGRNRPTTPMPMQQQPAQQPAAQPATAPAAAPQQRRRAGTPTQQLTPQGAVPGTPEQSYDVQIPGVGTFRTQATDPQRAALAIDAHLKGGGDPDIPPQTARAFDHNRFKVTQTATESSTVGGSIGAGPQQPLGDLGLEAFRMMVNNRIQEIVRKKEGGGGYNLYSPNKGKKKNPKPVGEFPTRLAAKRAELARFPPKDPEQLKKARKRLDKLAKDPKKRIDKEKSEMSARKPKRSGHPAGDRKKAKKEAFIRKLSNELTERLFREEELPGSPWDEKISGLHPDALAHDKKLHRFHQGMEKASLGALGDGHRALAKVLRGIAKVNPGDVSRDEERGKMFMPMMLDVDGDEIGPVHLYIDGGHVCIEVSPEAREAIAGLDPMMAKDLRGGLMSFQEDHLPKIDKAKAAWDERDSYLDKLHQRLEKTVGGLSPVEFHLARQMMAKRRR